MSFGDGVLLFVVGSLALNQAVLRLPGWEKRAWLFWLVQLLNLAVAIYVMGFGIPGLTGKLQIFNWVFGLMFVVKILQNNFRYADARKKALQQTDTAEEARKARIREALVRGQQEKDARPEPTPEDKP